MTIQSSKRGELTGCLIRIEGGKLLQQNKTPVSGGTSVRVENLFYNVPARLKFLKRDATERQNNEGYLLRYALAYPNVQFIHEQDGRIELQTTGSGDRKETYASIYGIELARQMMEVDYTDSDMSVSGFTSPISLTRSNRREITFFVNGRWVQDPSLSAALLQAYHTYLMVGRYPIAALFITMPPEDVDVNVHPAKAEVRFRTPDRIFSLIQRAIRKTLLISTPIPQVMPSGGTWGSALDFSWNPPVSEPLPDFQTSPLGAAPPNTEPATPPVTTAGLIPLLRLVGQVGAVYLVAEGPDGLYLIDQHAAHERVLFEKFTRQRGESIASQSLLEPAAVTLQPSQARLIETQMSILKQIGFNLESFGQNTFLVRAIPALFSKITPEAAIRVLVEDFEEDETPMQSELEAKLVARICKRAAVKAGQILTGEEQKRLLSDLENCQSPRTCPHGRPTMIHLSVDLLERQFGRKGAR
jgi:DNA mismatch repair protein MutL